MSNIFNLIFGNRLTVEQIEEKARIEREAEIARNQEFANGNKQPYYNHLIKTISKKVGLGFAAISGAASCGYVIALSAATLNPLSIMLGVFMGIGTGILVGTVGYGVGRAIGYGLGHAVVGVMKCNSYLSRKFSQGIFASAKNTCSKMFARIKGLFGKKSNIESNANNFQPLNADQVSTSPCVSSASTRLISNTLNINVSYGINSPEEKITLASSPAYNIINLVRDIDSVNDVSSDRKATMANR